MDLTSQDTLGKWLLQVLDSNNGRASKAQALQLMHDRFGHLLTSDDHLPEPKVKELKWENRTAWERDKLVKSGLLMTPAAAGHGIWALTPAGRQAARSPSAADSDPPGS